MRTQLYDKVDEYTTLDYTSKYYKQESFKETNSDLYEIFVGFEITTSESKHVPYLCWIYNDDIQQECVGINICAIDILNASPTDENEILSIAHNSDHDCRFILEYLENAKPIVKGGRFLQIKATYYNPIKRNRIKTTLTYNYELIPMALCNRIG